MPNPYHDENGRFCSKAEMESAVKRLAAAGDLEGYFSLRSDLEHIEKGQIVLTKETVLGLGSSSLVRNAKTEEELSSIYGVIKDKLVTGEYQNSYVTIVDLLESRLNDRDKEDLIRSLPAGLKSIVLNRIRNNESNKSPEYRYPYSSQMVKTFAEGDVDDGVVSELAYSKYLTFEDKYDIAKKFGGLKTLAYAQPKLFFNEPLLRQELKEELLNAKDYQKEDYAYAFAGSSNPEDLLLALDLSSNFDYNGPVARVSTSPFLTKEVSEKLLKKTLHSNVAGVNDVISDSVKTLKEKNRFYTFVLESSSYSYRFFEDTPEYRKLKQSAIEGLNRLSEDRPTTHIAIRSRERQQESYQAVLDSNVKSYKELKKVYDKHLKNSKGASANSNEWVSTKESLKKRLELAAMYAMGVHIMQRLQANS